MRQLSDQLAGLDFRPEGNPPEVYHLMLSALGLARDHTGTLTLRRIHRCTVYLHSEYPRRPPVLTWLTPIFHPNILPPDRNGGVCLGSWSASEGLGDLVRRVVELVSYRSFNVADALDTTAAAWVARAGIAPGADLQAVVSRSQNPDDEEIVVTLPGRGR